MSNTITASIAGVSTFALLIVALYQIPAWILLVLILVIASILGSFVHLDEYEKQYEAQENRRAERVRQLQVEQAEAREERQAINTRGIYIKPAYRSVENEQYRI